MNLESVLCDHNFAEALKSAVKASVSVKCVSDVNAAGGALLEIEICQQANRSLPAGYLCLTKPMIKALGNKIRVPNNYWNDITKTFHQHSRADIFLVKGKKIIDAVSIKTAIKEGNTKPSVHNDAEGEIHSMIGNGETIPNVGKVFTVTYNTRSGEVNSFFFDGDLNKIIDILPFHHENKSGNFYYKGANYGIGRQVLVSKPRHKAANRNKAQSSFNRGVWIDGQFLKDVCAPKNLVKNPHCFTLQQSQIMVESISKITAGRV